MADENGNWGRYLGWGMEIAAGVGLGCLIGYWLDEKLGWTPWGMVAFSMLGLAGGFYLLVKDVMKMNK